MNFLAETKQYYAEWLLVSPEVLDQEGVVFQYSPARDATQAGHSQPFDLYVYISGKTRVATYGKRLAQKIDFLKALFEDEIEFAELKQAAQAQTGKNLQHDFKYYFSQLNSAIDFSKAKQLTSADYSAYLRFFTRLYPESAPETWLPEYFSQMVSRGVAFGVFVGEELVCATDAPDMPYMQDRAVELGINTLPEYRRQGFPKIVLDAALKFVVESGKLPIVSCLSSNIASQKLIERVGFVKLADVFKLSL